MRLIWLLLLVVPSIAAATGMGYADARHLLARAGFTPTERELREFSTLSRAAAVDRLLAAPVTTARTPPPDWVNEFEPPRKLRARLKEASEAERKQYVRELIGKSLELRAWWLREMLDTPSPLSERMTLFWHNHFVSSQQKVKSPVLMYRQNRLLRQHALGNFGELLHAVAHDPAMVVYLDNVSNKKGSPNENFAREVMELFTLGEGHYTEQDIKEAARAFTGWSLDRNTGEYRFYRILHDRGEKTVLGRTGRFDGDEVLDILLEQPATAGFVVRKLWREFVSPDPDPAEVARLAGIFRNSRYDIKTVLRALFTSPAFYAPQYRAVLIKSPVEFIVGTLRLFDIRPADLRPLALATRNLGQDLFAPPNVKGWPGGESWINSSTLLARRQLLARLFRAEEMPVETARTDDMPPRARRLALAMTQDYRFQPLRWFNQFTGTTERRQSEVTRLVLAATPYELPAKLNDAGDLGALVQDPVYQLK